MGLFTRDIRNMNDLFVHQLQDVYYAEKQLEKALLIIRQAIGFEAAIRSAAGPRLSIVFRRG